MKDMVTPHRSFNFLEIFALVGRVSGSLDIEATLARNLKVGSCGVTNPLGGPVNLDREQSRNYRHAFRRIGAKVKVGAVRHDTDTKLASKSGAGDALDASFKIRLVCDSIRHLDCSRCFIFWKRTSRME
jgi:hypothetical protein